MRILKSNPILRLYNSYIVDSPQPSNISYLWNFGSLLALCLGIQIITGIFLVMHYSPSTEFAFDSVEHIMRNVNYGWAIRYTHANVASFFFIFVYSHLARGLYYNSYKSPRVAPWSIGVIILVLMMGTAFLGYCLVYGQMSHWGATVITNLLSAIPWIGMDFVEFEFPFVFENLIKLNGERKGGIIILLFYILMFIFVLLALPTIGAVRARALRGNKARTDDDKAFVHNIPYDFLSMFVGLVDGDGYIAIIRLGLSIKIELVILMDIRELKMLKYIQSVLNVGRIYEFPATNVVKYIINRTDLQEIIFPLLIFQKINTDFCFSLRQRTHYLLFEAFKIIFSTTRKIEDKEGYSAFVVSSKKDIQKVVNFFSFSNLHPLMEHKLVQYNNWISGLKQSSRYNNLNLPN